MIERRNRLVIGMSGASGAQLTLELLRQLRENPQSPQTILIVSEQAKAVLRDETDCTVEQLYSMADAVYEQDDLAAPVASGSFRCDGMIIVPCSMKTLAGIVTGYSENLLLRAADVTLKERRKLVLVPRECPLSTIHLRNLHEASQLGAVIIPPVISYYSRPVTVEECNRQIVGRILDQFGMEAEGYYRWKDQQGNELK